MIRRLPLLLLPLLAGCAPPPAVLPATVTSAAAKAPYLEPYCTRSLGWPDCWRNPQVLPGRPAALADVPHGAMPSVPW